MKTNLLGYTIDQLSEVMTSLGEKPYRGKQLFKWFYNTRVYEFNLMSDLSKEVREKLDKSYEFCLPRLEEIQTSIDGTIKFLFKLEDGKLVETVLIPGVDTVRKTLCISSQVGCALGCDFCATGTMGLIRDLTAGEIAGQMIFLRDKFGMEAFSNVVMMGMGEPLNNYDNVVNTIKIVTAPTGMAFSGKKITVSTSGITPKIKKLADADLKVKLAVSLHAAFQNKREKIMPVARTFKLEKLMQAIKYFAEKTKTKVTFEYIIFKDFNDSKDDVMALSKLVRGLPCKINLLAYNPVIGLPFERPSDEKVDWFGRQLLPRVPAVTVRKSRGQDIDAACGQLATKNANRSK